MCITTSGLCTLKRVINLKKSVEITGNILPSAPQSYFALIFRIILFIIFIIVLCIGASNINPQEFTQRESYTAIFAFFCITLYIVYLLIVIIFTLCFQVCKCRLSASTIGIIYTLSLPLIQCITATVWQIFIFGASTHDLSREFYIIFLLVIIFEFFLSTIQFNYISGTISVVFYNVLYIILFDVAIKNEAGSADNDALSIPEYIEWIILCVVWHILFTYIKNWVNIKWFTSNKIASNVNNFDILSTYSMSMNNNDSELMALSCNNVDCGDEYCRIVMGSCTDQRSKTIPVYQALHREQANIALLIGDNVYADLAPPTITKSIHKCCKTARVFKNEYDLLLNHKDFRPKGVDVSDQLWLALWDDHDYGENDAAKEYDRKVESKKAFIQFLEAINQTDQVKNQFSAIKDDDNRGVYYSFDYQQELKSGSLNMRIIMLDTRYDRAEDESDIVGEEQWLWLREKMNMNGDNDNSIDWYLLCNGSPILNEGKGGKKTVGQETRNKLFELLNENNGRLLDKTVLISGDLHYSVWHSWNEQIYELTASSITHSKPWFCCKCWYKYLEIDEYAMANDNDGYGATAKSATNCQKNSFGILKINKTKFNFCVKDAFGYSYLNVSHQKKK